MMTKPEWNDAAIMLEIDIQFTGVLLSCGIVQSGMSFVFRKGMHLTAATLNLENRTFPAQPHNDVAP